MIIRSRIIVPMVGDPIEDGAVQIKGNEIIRVGRFKEIRDENGEFVDLGEQILLPGLINAHCHLDYTALRGKIAPQQSFTDWLRAIIALKAKLKEADYLAGIEAGLTEAQRFGTTTIVNLEACPGLLPRLQQVALRVWWCAEMIDVREQLSVRQLTHELRSWFCSRPELLGGIGLAPHAPYTASAELFSEASALCREHDLLLTTHLAESDEEMRMFRKANGPLFKFLQEIGRPMEDCGRDTPISLLGRRHDLNERWIVAHLNEIAESDFELLATGKRFHVVHCPSSHAFFGHKRFDLPRLKELGFNVCLGTDSLASSANLSLFTEMRELIRSQPSITPRDALEFATMNGAKAVGEENRLGKISPGFLADFIALPCDGSFRDLFEWIVGCEGAIRWMMVNGRMVP